MSELNYTPVPNRIRVCHFPQVPCKPFIVEVENEKEAYLIEQALVNQHLWLYDNDFIPDYCNAITVDMWDENEWVDYWNDSECMEWDEFKETYFENDNQE